MPAAMVPYTPTRPLRGCKCQPRSALAGLAGSTKKRNGDAFGAAFPGINWKSDSEIILPTKFGGITINRDAFDDLAGTWYGATYHPDGDQAGWQQKFDAALKKYGAYNAFYGITAPQPVVISTQPAVIPVTPAPAPVPQPILLPTPAPTPATPVATIPPGGALPAVTLPATPSSPAITVNVPPTVAPDQTQGLIQQLIAQGASQQQAFAAALQSLAAQGIQATPQVQQQVAADVANASSPMQASTLYIVGGIAALALLGFAMRGRKRR